MHVHPCVLSRLFRNTRRKQSKAAAAAAEADNDTLAQPPGTVPASLNRAPGSTEEGVAGLSGVAVAAAEARAAAEVAGATPRTMEVDSAELLQGVGGAQHFASSSPMHTPNDP